MKAFVRRQCTGYLLAFLLSSAVTALADQTYELSASGRNEQAALGNLKMAALRQYLASVISPDDLRAHAKALRQEVFARVDTFVKPAGEVSYRTEQGKTYAAGKLQVNDEALTAIFSGTASLRGVSLADPAASGAARAASTPVSTQHADSSQTQGPVVSEPSPLPTQRIAEASSLQPAQTAVSSAVSPPEPEHPAASGTVKDRGSTAAGSGYAPKKSGLIPQDPSAYFKQKETFAEKLAELKADIRKGLDPNGNIYARGTEQPLLIFALRENDPELLQLLTQAGAEVNRPYQQYDDPAVSPLYFYLDYYGMGRRTEQIRLEMVKTLVEAGADPNWRLKAKSKISVFEAVFKAPFEFIEYYLSLKPDLEEHRDYAYRWLEKRTAEPWHLKVFALLLASGCDPNYQEGSGGLLVKACDQGAEYVKAALKAGAQVNILDARQDPLIFRSLDKRDPELLKLLVSNGADVNSLNHRGETLLVAALDDYQGDLAYLSTLLDLKADPNLKSEEKAPLFYALDSKHSQPLVSELLKRGATLQVQDEYGLSPVLYALANDNVGVDTLKTLVEHGADLKSTGPDGENALLMVLKERKRGVLPVVEFLITQGLGADVADENGMTALMAACDNIHCPAEVIELLIAKGASVNALSKNGISALGYAFKSRSEQGVRVLLQHGADLDYALNLTTKIKHGKGKTATYETLSWREFYRQPSEGATKEVEAIRALLQDKL